MEKVGTILESLTKTDNHADLEKQLIVMAVISKDYGLMRNYTDFVSGFRSYLDVFDMNFCRCENLCKQRDYYCTRVQEWLGAWSWNYLLKFVSLKLCVNISGIQRKDYQ